MTANKVIVHTDGACSGNPGPGGWGAILAYNGTRKELSGGEAETTNNRMELMGAIVALESLKRPCKVEMHVDSAYVKDGITKWIHGWKRNGWKTADKKPVKNMELWQRLDKAILHPRHFVALGEGPRGPRSKMSGPMNWPAQAWRPSSLDYNCSRIVSAPDTLTPGLSSTLSWRTTPLSTIME